MGLQCSRQGHIKDFHSYCDNKRQAPEGESFPVDFDAPRQFNEGNAVVDMGCSKEIVQLERMNSTCSPARERRENLIIGEENTQFCRGGKIVDLPPEGKVSIEKEFVELPCEKKVSLSDCYVELTPEETLQNPEAESITSKDEPSNQNNKWSYTLYDFQGKEMVTKQDLQQLMESICNVIEQSSADVAPKETAKNCGSSVYSVSDKTNSCHVRSPNKYAPSKQYKGMIFPPPNSEEAEKISCYIEEKLSLHRERFSKTGQFHRRKNDKLHSETCHCSSSSCKKNQSKLHSLPKRTKPCGGGEKTVELKCRSNKTSCHISNSNSSFSPASMSGTDTPQSTEEDHENDLITHRKTLTTICKTVHPQGNDDKIRLRHSCSCHQRIKTKMKPIEMNGVDQESSRCKEIKNAHREFLEGNYSPTCTSKKSSTASSTGSSEASVSSRSSTKTRSKAHSDREKRCNKESPIVLSKRNSNERNDPVKPRPNVWPGESCKEATVEKVNSVTTRTNSDSVSQLCFCKRMLGLDYPCNHNNTVNHTHKHEHHHYHYYIPKSPS